MIRPAGISRILAPLAPLLALAACAPDGSRQQAAEVLDQVLAQHRASIDGLGRSVGASPPRITAEPRRPPGPQGRGAPASAAALLGQGPDAVLSTLGTPSLRRPDGDAEIWLYLGPHCAVDVVLYRAGGAPRVAYAAARANSTEPRTESACLREVAAGSA